MVDPRWRMVPYPSLVYTHSVILVIQATWLVRYLWLWRYIHQKQNKITVVNWVFCQGFIVKPLWKYTNIQVLMTLKARKDFMMFKQRDLLWSGLLWLTFCTLEAMFTTTEENEVALSLFCDFGIFSQDQFYLWIEVNFWRKEEGNYFRKLYLPAS